MRRKARRSLEASIDLGAPSLERARHGAIVEIRTPGAVTRIAQAPIARYLKHDQISPRQYDAGDRLALDCELGVHGARNPEAHGSTGGTPTPISMTQLIALEAYQAAVKSMPKRLAAVVVAVCCDEAYADNAAGRLGHNRRGLMDVLRLGLDTLADHYRLPLDGAGRSARVGRDLGGRSA